MRQFVYVCVLMQKYFFLKSIMKTLHVINLHMYASLSMGPWLKNHYSICMHIGITLPQLLTLCHNGITETNTV